MGLKNFKADVVAAHQNASSGLIAGVSAVKMGDSDGEVVMVYHHDDLPTPLRVQAIIEGDVRDYPDATTFMFFTDTDDPPPVVMEVLSGLGDSVIAMTIPEVARSLAKSLGKVLSTSLSQAHDADGDELMTDAGEDDDVEDYDPDDYDNYDDNDAFGLGSSRRNTSHGELSTEQKALLRRVKRDLRKVHEAGYKVGILDGMGKDSVHGIISISIRVCKLALSEEVIEAWDLKENEYLVLLIRFHGPYKPAEQVLQLPASDCPVSFAIGKCDKYKPSLISAQTAFLDLNGSTEFNATEPPDAASVEFHKIFISNSLGQFMNEAFVSLMKLRESNYVSWDAANEILISKTGLIHSHFEETNRTTPEATISLGHDGDDKTRDHEILANDHLTGAALASERSIPLVAMQFAMRYFIRCTEFCLRCHRKLPKDFEALRPYVCDNPLCLFQYMAMGFGPSIEHEILTEPYVVDLLVSLCYASIQPLYTNRAAVPTTSGQAVSRVPIRTFPAGLHLQVPSIVQSLPSKPPVKVRITTTQDSAQLKLVCAEDRFSDRLMPGAWIAFRPSISPSGLLPVTHAIVTNTDSLSRIVEVSLANLSGINWGSSTTVGPAYASTYQTSNSTPASIVPPPDGPVMGELFLYDLDFDSLEDTEKALAMRHILDTLPSILKIEEYLALSPHRSLRSMKGVSPAAASLLQWIVSSNRSCIFQVERSRGLVTEALRNQTPWDAPHVNVDGAATRPCGPGHSESQSEAHQKDERPAGRGRNREEERIPGMEGWVQFKFAQGSPDKELRFKRALQQVAARKDLTSHPTIFAWHGSALSNWHSIVRTGLDYNDIRSGRAYGNGVYFSPLHGTSLGYAGTGSPWPGSDLKLNQCMSLNEIINAPDEFVSTTPHWVVAHNDWHQCRYLFVQVTKGPTPARVTSSRTATSQPMTPSNSSEGRLYHKQAPGWEVMNTANKPMKIPLAAIPLRTVGAASQRSDSSSKRPITILDEASEAGDIEDIGYLSSDEDWQGQDAHQSKKATMPRSSSVDTFPRATGLAPPPTPTTLATLDANQTDFQPGSLDMSTLPRLSEPSWATGTATKALGRELSALQKIQTKEPLHELGWYIDFDNVENLYQWIVEFHSFDDGLPLAQDMKKDEITSVVMEVRFPRSFPFDPPFVRVLRPRFLPFLEGGGGHITAGGAVCMELLTTTGWSPASSMESVLLQVRMAMCSVDPRPGRLASSRSRSHGYGWNGDYGIGEAVDAYVRAARTHGWKVPDDLQQTATGV